MINVHSDLIRKELPILGVDAFAVLMCITSHINAKRQAWPGIDRLRTMTGLSKERTYKAIQTLISTGHVERSQENSNGEWGKVVYRVTTQHLSIFMGVSSFEFDSEEKQPLARNPEYAYPEHAKPESGKAEHISIDHSGSIGHKEVLKKGKRTPAPLPEYHSTAVHQRDVKAVMSNPNAWRDAVGRFKTLAGMRNLEYDKTYLDAFFSNEQKYGRYHDLAAPANEADTHIWLSKHFAGLQLWAMRQGQFERKQTPGQTPDQPAKAGFSLPK